MRLCTIKGCVRPAQNKADGLCRPHRNRFVKTGSVGGPRIRPRRVIPPYRGEA